MEYIDGLVSPVPTANQEAYLAHARQLGALFKAHGALRVVETWGDDVPPGKLTSFPLAVKCEPHENVALSWIVWPSRAVRDAGWKTLMTLPEMQPGATQMPFDGRRMIYGGFQMIMDL